LLFFYLNPGNAGKLAWMSERVRFKEVLPSIFHVKLLSNV